ncbi:MAG: ChaN family lipoprotein [Litoreibacter sp.]|uniref:ChaN family lipoprotein n=1 Tax=Litoreibacter sp. TaxID=1969459 RepID=UPI0032980E34
MMRIAMTISACAFASMANGEVLTTSAFESLGAADIVIMGEQHDNALHHVNQAKVAGAIYPSALVFEMLTPAQAEAGQAANRAVFSELDAALDWSARGGWPAFHNYFSIFATAPQARIYGAAVPRETVRAAIGDGAASQFGEGADYGLDVPLPASEQSAREELQGTAHCSALPEDMLAGMVEAQRLRDASFARTTLQALEDTGGPVLVITGNGHARTDWGVPFYVRQVAPQVNLIAVGQLEEGEIAPPYDRWIMTGSFGADRDDPCEAFSSN